MEIINMGGQISFADFGQYSLTVYKYQPFVNDYSQKYEGYIMFQSRTVKAFDPPVPIRELEKITGMVFHFKNNFNTGRGYYKIPTKFKSVIKSSVKEV